VDSSRTTTTTEPLRHASVPALKPTALASDGDQIRLSNLRAMSYVVI
jgi:hypothetical protein